MRQEGGNAFSGQASQRENPMNDVVMTQADPCLTLAALAGQINAEHEQVEAAAQAALGHARAAGELLLQAKARIGHGN
jgi:hypothetical protein